MNLSEAQKTNLDLNSLHSTKVFNRKLAALEGRQRSTLPKELAKEVPNKDSFQTMKKHMSLGDLKNEKAL